MNDQTNFAIFRTRFQPYTEAHDWAIRNFIYWADTDPNRTFNIKSLVLAAVDPLLKPIVKNIQREHVRFEPKLNPYTEWGILHVLHSRRCHLAMHGNNHIQEEAPTTHHETNLRGQCRKVIIARIPALTPLSYEEGADDSCLKDKRRLIKELKYRLPIAPNNVWYFPCFDQEDLNDILALWNAMKEGQKIRKDELKIPEMRMVVSYHPGFAYQRVNSRSQTIVMGPYGEATLQIAGIPSERPNEGMALFPTHIKALLDETRPSDWDKAVKKCLRGIHTCNLRNEDDLYHISREKMENDLKEHCTRLFGAESCAKNLKFLPPEQNSEVLLWRAYLLQSVFKPLESALSGDFDSVVGNLKKKVECRSYLTSPESLDVLRQIVKNVRQSGIRFDSTFTTLLSDWETRTEPPPETNVEAVA